jgi:hypothetical protein
VAIGRSPGWCRTLAGVHLTEHDVSDPGITLLRVVVVAVPVLVVAAGVFLLRRSRRRS